MALVTGVAPRPRVTIFGAVDDFLLGSMVANGLADVWVVTQGDF